MASKIKIKRSAVAGKVPLTTDLELSELAVNTNDGRLYTKKDNGTESIVEIGGPDFGSRNITTTGTVTGASLNPTSGTVPTNGVYLPAANTVGISTNGTERLRVDASGRLLLGATAAVDNDSSIESAKDGENRLKLISYADSNISQVIVARARGTQATPTLVNNGNALGAFAIQGYDGTSFVTAAKIDVTVNGSPSTGSVPGAVIVSTTAVGGTSPTERLRIDSAGRMLIGTTSAANTYRVGSNSRTPAVQIQGPFSLPNLGGALSINCTNEAARFFLANSSTVAANAVVGVAAFAANDGTSALLNAASIECQVDGTPGTNDMPGRLVFSTTADGAISPTEAMRINNAQELLIGYTTDNGAYRLQVNSQIFATSATIATSDGRYKENIATLNGCIDLVKALRPVSFDWKPQQDITRINDDGNEVLVREGHNFPGGTQVGFIAQEVQTVLAGKPWLNSVIKQNVRPAVISSDGNVLAPEEEFLGIAEGNLISVLTSALKESIERIETLEAKVAALEGA